jgi:hypothetical protein
MATSHLDCTGLRFRSLVEEATEELRLRVRVGVGVRASKHMFLKKIDNLAKLPFSKGLTVQKVLLSHLLAHVDLAEGV